MVWRQKQRKTQAAELERLDKTSAKSQSRDERGRWSGDGGGGGPDLHTWQVVHPQGHRVGDCVRMAPGLKHEGNIVQIASSSPNGKYHYVSDALRPGDNDILHSNHLLVHRRDLKLRHKYGIGGTVARHPGIAAGAVIGGVTGAAGGPAAIGIAGAAAAGIGIAGAIARRRQHGAGRGMLSAEGDELFDFRARARNRMRHADATRSLPRTPPGGGMLRRTLLRGASDELLQKQWEWKKKQARVGVY
jgi:hypothetical protein